MSVHETLTEVFRTVFDDDGLVLRDEMTAADIRGWDSLEHVNLMFALEERFGVRFADGQLAEFENIGELRRFLEREARQSR